jgi:predicted nucleic acid-binding protein
MAYPVDTNILLRFVNVNDPEHALVSEAVRRLLQRGEVLHYAQQNRREFWNVCTRPANRNGLGYSVEEAILRVSEVDAVFSRIPDQARAGPIWDRLVRQYRVMGVAVHDAQLVATMLAHGINRILTLNVADFERYTEVTAVHPQTV